MKYKNDPLLKMLAVCLFGLLMISGYNIFLWQDYYGQAMDTIAELKCPMMQYETEEYLHGMAIECHKKATDIGIGGFCNGLVILDNDGSILCIETLCESNPKTIVFKNFTIGRFLPEENKIECFAGPKCTHVTNEGCANRLTSEEIEIACEKVNSCFEELYEKSQKFTLEEMG